MSKLVVPATQPRCRGGTFGMCCKRPRGRQLLGPSFALGVMYLLTGDILYAKQPAVTVQDSVLVAIAARGRALADHLTVLANATAAASHAGVVAIEEQILIAEQMPPGAWRASTITENHAGQLWLAYSSIRPPGDSAWLLRKESRRLVPGEYIQRAATALLTARRDHGPTTRVYHTVVVPNGEQGFFVYRLPARQSTATFAHGGDIRYTVSSDGLEIVQRRLLHRTVMDLPAPPDSVFAGLHTAVVDDVPEDTDVSYVLTRFPRKPELVVTRRLTFEIGTDGSIRVQR